MIIIYKCIQIYGASQITKKAWVFKMANCKQCGADLNGAKFCPNCGASATGEMTAQQVAYAGGDTRQRSLAEMERMRSYFGAKKQWYDDFDTVSAEVEERSARTYGGWIWATVIAALIGIFKGAFFFYIAAVACVVLFVVCTKKNKTALTAATHKQEKIANKLQAYYDEYGYCPIGFEYTKPSTLEVLYDYIRKGRASNPGDAINIYLADEDRTKMLKLQEEATEAAKQTAKNTKKAAKQAKRAAGYSSASFWFK